MQIDRRSFLQLFAKSVGLAAVVPTIALDTARAWVDKPAVVPPITAKTYQDYTTGEDQARRLAQRRIAACEDGTFTLYYGDKELILLPQAVRLESRNTFADMTEGLNVPVEFKPLFNETNIECDAYLDDIQGADAFLDGLTCESCQFAWRGPNRITYRGEGLMLEWLFNAYAERPIMISFTMQISNFIQVEGA